MQIQMSILITDKRTTGFWAKFGQSEAIGFLFDIRNSQHPHGYTYDHESFVESFNDLIPVIGVPMIVALS